MGVSEIQVEPSSIPLEKTGVGFLDLTNEALSLFGDGFFSADAAGRAKFGDGLFTPAKLDRAYQEKLSPLTTSNLFGSLKDTDEIATGSVVVNEESVRSFPDGSVSELKTSFVIPRLYDNVGAVTFSARISPSTSFSGDFRLSIEYRINGGALSSPTLLTVTPSATANQQTAVSVLVLPASLVSPGDRVVVKIKRLGSDVLDTHTGSMQMTDMGQSVPT